MGAVDVWSQITTERFMQVPWLDTILRWTGQTEWRPASPETRPSPRWTRLTSM